MEFFYSIFYNIKFKFNFLKFYIFLLIFGFAIFRDWSTKLHRRIENNSFLCLSLNYSTYFLRDTGLPRDHLWRLHIHILYQYWFVSLILFGMLSSFLSWIYLSFRDLVSLSFSFYFFFYFLKKEIDSHPLDACTLMMKNIKKIKKELHLYRCVISNFFFFSLKNKIDLFSFERCWILHIRNYDFYFNSS